MIAIRSIWRGYERFHAWCVRDAGPEQRLRTWVSEGLGKERLIELPGRCAANCITGLDPTRTTNSASDSGPRTAWTAMK